jgi:hypothetical protein
VKNSFFCSIIISGLLLFSSCDTSLRYVQIADKFAASGNYADAADNYYTAYSLNPGNVKAKQGLEKNAQLNLDAKFNKFAKFIVEESIEDALRQYNDCKLYFQNVKNIVVEIHWPNVYDKLYETNKDEFVSKQYQEGINLMKDEKFEKAELSFKKILEFDSSYKNVSALHSQSLAEPIYEKGLKNFEQQNYKLAYKNFLQVSSMDASYKNTSELLDESLKKASLPIAIIVYDKNDEKLDLKNSFYFHVVSNINKSQNPFLKVIDRSNTEKLLKEQELSMSGMIDYTSAAKAGKMLGVKYFLILNIGNVNIEEQALKATIKIAYDSYTHEFADKNTGQIQSEILYRSVNYLDYSAYRKLNSSIAYQLLSVETGEVVLSDIYQLEKSDYVNYAKYSGNPRNLSPSIPNGNESSDMMNQWRAKFNTPARSLQSPSLLMNMTLEESSIKMVDAINSYIEK